MKAPFPPLSFKVGIVRFRTFDDAQKQACEQAKENRRRSDTSPVTIFSDDKPVAEVACTADAVDPVIRFV